MSLPNQTQFQPAPRTAALVWGIILLVVGAILGAGGVLVFITPIFLFLAGGGGNVDAFADFARPIYLTGAVLAFVGVAALIVGIVLLVRRAKTRRAERMRAFGWPAG